MAVTSQQTLAEFNAFIEPPLSSSGHEPPVLEQHGIQLDPFAHFYIIAQLLNQFLQSYALTGQTDQHHDGILIHAGSRFCIPAEDLIQFLKHNAYYTEQSSCAGGNQIPAEQNGTPFYPASWLIPGAELYEFLQRHVHPASGLPSLYNGYEIPAEQNDMPVEVPLLLIPEESLSQFLQRHWIPPVPPSFDSGHWHETPAVQQLQVEDSRENDSTSRSVTPAQSQDSHETPAVQLEDGREGVPMSRSVTPTQSQDSDDQVDAQLDEATASPYVCPVCQRRFRRAQERNRHVESYLPHSILCPFWGCTWTGRRQWDFQEHWISKHQEADQAPEEYANEIYDTKDFVESILGGAPVDEVARSAFAKVQENIRRLGKPLKGAKVLGRSRHLRKWIRIPLS